MQIFKHIIFIVNQWFNTIYAIVKILTLLQDFQVLKPSSSTRFYTLEHHL